MLGKPKFRTGGSTWGFFYVPKITRNTGIFASDDKGQIFIEFFRTLASEKGTTLPDVITSAPNVAANQYITNYGLVAIIQNRDGAVFCYSYRYRNKLPPEFVERVRSHMKLMPEDSIFWSNDVTKAPRSGPAREIVYGQPTEKKPKSAKTAEPYRGGHRQTRAQKGQNWVNVKPLTKDEMDFLTGKRKDLPGS